MKNDSELRDKMELKLKQLDEVENVDQSQIFGIFTHLNPTM